MERHRALSDLLNDNGFLLKNHPDITAYHLHINLIGHELNIEVQDTDKTVLETLRVNMRGFKKIVKDYFTLCDSFYKLAREGQHAKIEAVDMARRGIHNEGAEMLQKRLERQAVCAFSTARQLFTLICVLHIRVTV